MKHFLVLGFLLFCAVSGYAQDYQIKAITTFDGRADKPEILATIYNIVDDGEQLDASFFASNGYDARGGNTRSDFVRVTVRDANGIVRYLDYIQISNSLELTAREIINPMSNISSNYAKSICSQQYAALKRARIRAKQFEMRLQQKEYVAETIPSNQVLQPTVIREKPLPAAYVPGVYAGYNANYGSLPNRRITDFSPQYGEEKVKRKWAWVWITAAGLAAGYILADGISDGEWFDWNFQRPRIVVINPAIPPDGPGPDLNPSGSLPAGTQIVSPARGIIMRF
jgi:hypothetical protein